MASRTRLSFLGALLFAVAIPVVPQISELPHNSSAESDWPELQKSMEKMHSGMASVNTSGVNDVDFVRLMLPHHQAAIDMAKTQLLYGKDPQIRRLAQEIITEQQSEVELMQLWLKAHTAQK